MKYDVVRVYVEVRYMVRVQGFHSTSHLFYQAQRLVLLVGTVVAHSLSQACSVEVFHYIIGCIVGTEHFVHPHEAIVLATKGIEAVCLGLEIVEAFLEVTEHRLRYHDCAVGVAFTAVCHIALFHAKQRFYGNTPYEYFG